MNGIAFSTIMSSSAGNCAVIAGPVGTILFDAGFSSQKGFRKAIGDIREKFGPIKAALISHAHRDHINYSTLKVFSNLNIPVFFSIDTVERLSKYDNCREPLKNAWIEIYDDLPFMLAGFKIMPVPLKHHPGICNHGFVIEAEGVKIGLATDLRDTTGIEKHFAGLDFLYFESNYDPGLLRINYNPNSLYHLSNEKSAEFISSLCNNGDGPKLVCLAHLSTQRNRPDLALAALRKRLDGNKNPPRIMTAPAFDPSDTIIVHPTEGVYISTGLFRY